MKVDLHLHSKFSWDSSVSIESYITEAERKNFSAISITDHNNIESHEIIKKLQNETSVFLIPGQEISTLNGHILAYGWISQIPSGLSMIETVNLINSQNGFAVAAHPYDPFRGGYFSKIFEASIYGFEILNASSWFSFPNWMAKRAQKKYQDYVGVANSDSHKIDEFGSAYSILPDTTKLTINSIFVNLKNCSIGGSRIGILRKLKRLLLRKLN